MFEFLEQEKGCCDVLFYAHCKLIQFPGSALPDKSMTEQQKLTINDLYAQLDTLMLRDKQRFARRLQGSKKVKNPESHQALLQQIAEEAAQAAAKVAQREASRPVIDYPENLPVSQKKQAILEAVRDN